MRILSEWEIPNDITKLYELAWRCRTINLLTWTKNEYRGILRLNYGRKIVVHIFHLILKNDWNRFYDLNFVFHFEKEKCFAESIVKIPNTISLSLTSTDFDSWTVNQIWAYITISTTLHKYFSLFFQCFWFHIHFFVRISYKINAGKSVI